MQIVPFGASNFKAVTDTLLNHVEQELAYCSALRRFTLLPPGSPLPPNHTRSLNIISKAIILLLRNYRVLGLSKNQVYTLAENVMFIRHNVDEFNQQITSRKLTKFANSFIETVTCSYKSLKSQQITDAVFTHFLNAAGFDFPEESLDTINKWLNCFVSHIDLVAFNPRMSACFLYESGRRFHQDLDDNSRISWLKVTSAWLKVKGTEGECLLPTSMYYPATFQNPLELCHELNPFIHFLEDQTKLQAEFEDLIPKLVSSAVQTPKSLIHKDKTVNVLNSLVNIIAEFVVRHKITQVELNQIFVLFDKRGIALFPLLECIGELFENDVDVRETLVQILESPIFTPKKLLLAHTPMCEDNVDIICQYTPFTFSDLLCTASLHFFNTWSDRRKSNFWTIVNRLFFHSEARLWNELVTPSPQRVLVLEYLSKHVHPFDYNPNSEMSFFEKNLLASLDQSEMTVHEKGLRSTYSSKMTVPLFPFCKFF
jgi:hypothetical protein